jgi:hypothetical protein
MAELIMTKFAAKCEPSRILAAPAAALTFAFVASFGQQHRVAGSARVCRHVVD